MADPATFLSELENKHLESCRQLTATYVAGVAREALTVTDVLKLEVKAAIEAIEVAALWIPDADPVEFKLSLAAHCGDRARHVRQIDERLTTLGVHLAAFDPRHGGYSKLFAFLRSLQTPEERTAAGFVTLGNMNLVRGETLAAFCEAAGDAETAGLLRDQIVEDERRHVDEGRRMLLGVAVNEESQARARRSTYRVVELLGDMLDPAAQRKMLSRAIRK